VKKINFTKAIRQLKLGFTSDLSCFCLTQNYVYAGGRDYTVRVLSLDKTLSSNQKFFENIDILFVECRLIQINIEGEPPSAICTGSSENEFAVALGDSNVVMLGIVKNEGGSFTGSITKKIQLSGLNSFQSIRVHYLVFGDTFLITVSKDDKIARIWDLKGDLVQVCFFLFNIFFFFLKVYPFNQGALYEFSTTSNLKYSSAACSMGEAKV
jgi:WD40 repeat protein